MRFCSFKKKNVCVGRVYVRLEDAVGKGLVAASSCEKWWGSRVPYWVVRGGWSGVFSPLSFEVFISVFLIIIIFFLFLT